MKIFYYQKIKKNKKILKTNTTQIIKIQLNRGLGKFGQNKIIIQKSINEFRAITGQHPIITIAKKSISGFNLREKTIIGLKVTLRKKFMHSFLDRLIHLSFPQITDFNGFSIKNFDNAGNFNLGIEDQSIFPELQSEYIDTVLGFNINIIFSNKNKNENIKYLKELKFPFSEK